MKEKISNFNNVSNKYNNTTFNFNNIEVHSFAKLNLDLKIGDFDKDKKLHKVLSHIVAIDFYETLIFNINIRKSTSNGSLKFTQTPREQGCEKNENGLIYKAAKIWCETQKIDLSLEVFHDDRVQAGFGLGIASSNAGVTILTLEKALSQTGLSAPISREKLAEISLSLGSDVAFFTLNGENAIISGFGEKITPFFEKEKRTFLLHLPNYKISTKEAFAALYDQNNKRIHNSFIEIEPNKSYYDFLKENTGCDKWRLTGTGSAFFIENPTDEILEKSKNWNIKTILVNQK